MNGNEPHTGCPVPCAACVTFKSHTHLKGVPDMTGKASRDKGARFERAIAAQFKHHGYQNAERQLERRRDQGDIQGGPAGIHVECKDHGTLNLSGWLDQAHTAASPDSLPVVIHKRRNKPVADSYVTMTLTTFCHIIKS